MEPGRALIGSLLLKVPECNAASDGIRSNAGSRQKTVARNQHVEPGLRCQPDADDGLRAVRKELKAGSMAAVPLGTLGRRPAFPAMAGWDKPLRRANWRRSRRFESGLRCALRKPQ